MRKILRDGIKPHPYLYPAYEQNRAKILNDVQTAVETL
jgi:hypothetical protein